MIKKDIIEKALANDNSLGVSIADIARQIAYDHGIEYNDSLRRYVSIIANGNKRHVKKENILVIGDLHAPFLRKGYLDFCIEIYKKHKCNKVILIGDIIDNHYTSFHDADPDGHSARKELELAIAEIQEWYKAFPEADVCSGNHDQIPDRQAFSAGISKRWIKSIGDVLEVPNWTFAEEFIYNDIRYTHGTGRKAKGRTKDDLMSTVQGHYHAESYVEWFVGRMYKIFAMQVGCGMDDKSFAAAYGRNFKKMHINCGVVLNDGKLPILEYMEL